MALYLSKASIEYKLRGLKDLEKQLVEIDKVRKAKAAEFSTAMSGLQNRLAAGETTGDRLQDLVIRAHDYGKGFEEVLVRYRELEAALKGKKGQFVLLSFGAKIPFKFTMTGREYRDVNCYRLGVLTGESLTWAGKTGSFELEHCITVPVSQFSDGEIGSHMLMTIQKGHLFVPIYRDADPNPLPLMMERGDEWKEELIIGNDAVKKWLERHAMPELFKTAVDALGMYELEPTEEGI